MATVSLARIAVAVDGSTFADRAVELAIEIAKRFGSTITVIAIAPMVPLYVSSTEPWVPTEVPESSVSRFKEIVDAAVAKAKAAGASQVNGVCLEGVIVDELVGYIDEHPQDLLIMGSRGLSGTKRLLLGSVSDAVIHHAKCPVLVMREAARPPA